MTTGATLATGSLLASIGAATEGDRPLLEDPVGWSSYDGSARNTRSRSSMDNIDAPETVAWQYDASGSPVIVDGTVYLQTDGEVHALDAADGTPLWTSDDVGASGTPAVAGGTVYTAGTRLTAFSADTGGLRWSVDLDADEPVASPTVAFETVYVTVDGTLRAFNAVDGTPRWERETIDVAYSPPGQDGSSDYAYGFHDDDGAVAASNATLWALLDERRNEGILGTAALAAIDPLTGEARWTDHLELGHTADGLTALEGTLLVENGVDEEVVVFDTGSGEPEETVPDAFVTAATEDAVVTRGRNGLTATTADSSWSAETVDGFGAPVIVGDTIVVGYTADTQQPDAIRGLDLEDGTERWRFEFDERQWMSGFGVEVAVGDEIVCVDRDEGLTAVRSVGDEDSADDEGEADDADESEDETGDKDGDESGEEEVDGGDGADEDETGDDGETDDAGESDDTAEETGDESYDGDEEPSDDETGDGEAVDDEPNGGDDRQNDGGNDAGDEGGDGTGDEDDGAETTAVAGDDGSADAADGTDGTDGPERASGFTAGAGIAGGALGLKWLRRRGLGEETVEE